MTRLLLPGKTFKNTTASAVQKIQTKSLTPEAEALKHIRSASCYRALRTLIDVGTVIAIVALFFFGLATSFMALSYGLSGTLLGVAILLFSVLVVVALRQSMLLLVDIADCQIQSYRGGPQRL
jgi:type III secretory pathway component EscU